MNIDVTYDFRRDSKGKDPDTHSDTLRAYHQRLWSKHLPTGQVLELTIRGRYLHHSSVFGEFTLASDAVVPAFGWVPHLKAAIAESELESFNAKGYTIGGMMVWPAVQIDRQWTINQARVGLIRFRGHVPKGGYDVPHAHTEAGAPAAPTVH